MLLLDRYLGMHFFTNDAGGNQMMYVNLFWAWGHPEVYILILPAFGVFSEVAATFSGKGLFSYRSMVLATLGICVLSFMVWLHHFFTMGAGADVNAFFGIMSSIIAVPTGAKVFNWLFTLFRGRIVFTTPVLFLIGFMVTFVIGGLTGVLLAVPPVDFVLHNSAFLVAHFHNVIIGGVVFGMFAGYNYWFPKAFGFTLDERWGKASFWCWLIGFYLAFMPLYVLGLMGMTRRLQHIPDPSWQPLAAGRGGRAPLSFSSASCARSRSSMSASARASSRRDLTGDPWNGRTLEWATSSPPPAYNFAVLPRVETIDAFWDMKRTGTGPPVEPAYETDRDAAQQPDRLCHRLLCGGHRLFADLAYLVDGDPRPPRRCSHGPGVRLEREPGARNLGRPKLREWSGPGWAWGGPHDDSDDRRGSDRARARARWRRTGLDADRRRLWVLDLHPQRHRHVLGAVCRLCGLVGQHRRRTDRGRAIQSPQCLHRDDVPAGLELHMRARGVVRRTAAAGALSGLRCPDIRARCGLSLSSRARNSPAW